MYPVTLGIPVHKNEANITVKAIIRGLKNQSSITNNKSTRDNLIDKFNIPTTKSIEKKYVDQRSKSQKSKKPR